MARKAEVWQAPPETLAPMPETSGNEINGLGEKEFRPTSPFFWHEPQHHLVVKMARLKEKRQEKEAKDQS